MFKGYKYGDIAPYIILAIGLILIAVAFWHGPYLKGYQSANDTAKAQHAEYQSRQDRYEECLRLPSLEEARMCASNTKEATREYHRAEDDLNAQREMAQWAEAMFWATVFASVVGAIGVVLVYQTLSATRQMNKIAMVGERAWMRLERLEEGNVIIDSSCIKWGVLPRFKNIGKTPATEVFVSAKITSVRDVPLTIKTRPHKPASDFLLSQSRSVVFPNDITALVYAPETEFVEGPLIKVPTHITVCFECIYNNGVSDIPCKTRQVYDVIIKNPKPLIFPFTITKENLIIFPSHKDMETT